MTTPPSSEPLVDLYLPQITLPDKFYNDETTPGDTFMFAQRNQPEK